MARKLAILFPGVGYHTDKPLLYYAKKLAASLGYQIVEVSYSGFPSDMRGNAEKMRMAFDLALEQAENSLQPYAVSAEDDLLFVSKSIGTAVSAAWQMKHQIRGKNIYFTPVEETFRFVRACSGIVFHGTNDPWVTTAIVETKCIDLQLPLYTMEGANHSLETGNVVEDLIALTEFMRCCEKYLSKEQGY